VITPLRKFGVARAVGKFLLGCGAGWSLHEAGHLVANWAFEEKVVVRKSDYKGHSIFCAQPRARPLAAARVRRVVCGFWAQYLYSEQILTHHPNLKSEKARFEKAC
jgi:hypothetical protein